MSYSRSEAVEREIAARREADARDAEERSKPENVAARVHKQAGAAAGSGMAGFATANLGAQIAAAASKGKKNKNGRLDVKATVKEAE